MRGNLELKPLLWLIEPKTPELLLEEGDADRDADWDEDGVGERDVGWDEVSVCQTRAVWTIRSILEAIIGSTNS